MRFAGMARRQWLLAVLAGVAVVLAACGGGSGDGGQGGEAPDGAYSAAQRSAATGRIAQKFEQLAAAGAADPAAWAALRDWVLTQPEFTEAGVDDRLLWARFTDGRYFLYTDNWRGQPQQQGAQPAPPIPAQAVAAAPAGSSALAAAGLELPGTANAVILSMKGQGEFNSNAGMLAQMDKVLKDRGWKVAPERLLTIASLKAMREPGFVFVTTHSGIFGPTGQKQFAFMLETQVSVFNEDENKADLDEGRLIYHRDRTDWQRYGLGSQPRYAATAKFVTRYMKFAPNSLLILLSCNSGSDEAAGFRAALMQQGAGTIIGWENNSSANAYPTVNVLMDRLTGRNEMRPVTPANRPFNLDEVWAYLGKKDLLVNEAPQAEPGEPPYKEAYVRRFGSGFTVIAPVIHALQAVGKTLTLHGEFGSQPGTLTVGGAGVAATWSADGKKVKAVLANGTHGDVVVTTRGLRSNTRVLASWRTQVRYEHEEEAVQNCHGAKFHNTAVIDVHLRADAHAVRTEVDGPLRNNPHLVVPAPDTRATWTADGNCTIDGSLHTRWSGNGTLAFNTDIDFDDPVGVPSGNLLVGRFDALERRFQFSGVFGHTANYTVTSLGVPPFGRPLHFDMDLAGFRNDAEGELVNGTYLPVGATLEIGGGAQKKTDPDQGHSLSVAWSPGSPTPAYDDSVPR